MARGYDDDGFVRESEVLVAQALAEARMGAGGWWVAKCPFCEERVGTPDRHGKFGVNAASGKWHCFRCHSKGKLRSTDATTARALERMRERTRPESKEPDMAYSRVPEGWWPLWEGPALSSETLRPALEYLRKRGVTDDVMRAARIGACTSGKYGQRIIVPCVPSTMAPPAGRVVSDDDVLDELFGAGVGDAQPNAGTPWHGFVARTWLPKDACDVTYLYPTGMHRDRIVFNDRALGVVTDTPVAVVEGVFDTFPLWPDAVAVLGSASELQVQALLAAKRPVAVVLDGDAWRSGVALAQRLQFDGQQAGAVILPPRLDPDEVPADVLRAAMWECVETGEARL